MIQAYKKQKKINLTVLEPTLPRYKDKILFLGFLNSLLGLLLSEQSLHLLWDTFVKIITKEKKLTNKTV